MDWIGIVIIAAAVAVVLSLCSYCCKRHRGKVLGPPQQSGLTITTSTTTGAVAHPPYPVAPHHPVPQAVPAPGIGFQAPVHTGYPYPVGQGPVMPQPYPPQPSQSAVAPPPSYHEAIGHPITQPQPMHEQYVKQAPYNPNY